MGRDRGLEKERPYWSPSFPYQLLPLRLPFDPLAQRVRMEWLRLRGKGGGGGREGGRDVPIPFFVLYRATFGGTLRKPRGIKS